MKKLRLGIAALVIVCFTSACAFHHYALNVPPGNTAWDPEPESVIVLLGYVSDQPLTSVSREDDAEVMSLNVWHNDTNRTAVLALHQRAGETFQLTGVTYPSDAPTNLLEHKWYVLEFANLPALHTPTPGIYFYGSLLIENNRGLYSKNAIPVDEVIEVAQRKYGKVFESLTPVNF